MFFSLYQSFLIFINCRGLCRYDILSSSSTAASLSSLSLTLLPLGDKRQHVNSDHCTQSHGKANLQTSWMNRWYLRAGVSTCASTCTFFPHLFSWGNVQSYYPYKYSTCSLCPLQTGPNFSIWMQLYGWLGRQHQPYQRFSDEIISSSFSGADNIGTHSELEDRKHWLWISVCIRERNYGILLWEKTWFSSMWQKNSGLKGMWVFCLLY